MLAFRLLRHALWQLWGNRVATLRLSLVPGLVWLAFGAGPMLVFGQPQLRVAGDDAAVLVAVGLLAMVLYVVMAVAWHRHVLLDEPARLRAAGRGRQVLGYLGRVLLIMVALVPALIGAILLMHLLVTIAIQSGGRPIWPQAIASVVGVVLTALMLRLLTALPGASVRHPRPFGAAWAATKGQVPTFLLLGVVVVVGQTLLPHAISIVATMSITLAVLLQVLLSWLGALIMLSLITTLWGHFVEGRALR